MSVVLETRRLVLRQFTESDLDDLVELDADPQVMQFINGGRPTPRVWLETQLLPMYLGQYAAGDRYGRWAAVAKSTADFLGVFHFRPAVDRPPDEPELGMGPLHRGQRARRHRVRDHQKRVGAVPTSSRLSCSRNRPVSVTMPNA